ncbi:hypothetical protein H6F67_10390 [Microcoleus sp. FACHB-1515]|uniref:hypothetical protein n=1 Tax=Cyanophyceae TaxID=3028117 RepID=UPI001683C182|nr:hypothetical protein [Microcoleus sp. FACHB-1515]MBD2090261.1 hypothetical protein [Microcoleus sp. FACHB-1515]
MNTCPCCSQPLLRHARRNSIYWFCSHCWQEMPNLSDRLTVPSDEPVCVPTFTKTLSLARYSGSQAG